MCFYSDNEEFIAFCNATYWNPVSKPIILLTFVQIATRLKLFFYVFKDRYSVDIVSLSVSAILKKFTFKKSFHSIS